MFMGKQGSASGFSLVEGLLALAVLIIGVTAFTQFMHQQRVGERGLAQAASYRQEVDRYRSYLAMPEHCESVLPDPTVPFPNDPVADAAFMESLTTTPRVLRRRIPPLAANIFHPDPILQEGATLDRLFLVQSFRYTGLQPLSSSPNFYDLQLQLVADRNGPGMGSIHLPQKDFTIRVRLGADRRPETCFCTNCGGGGMNPLVTQCPVGSVLTGYAANTFEPVCLPNPACVAGQSIVVERRMNTDGEFVDADGNVVANETDAALEWRCSDGEEAETSTAFIKLCKGGCE
ncbi:MAG: hypothetical protein AB7P04_06565 [Bacteriovoracia bacterium]